MNQHIKTKIKINIRNAPQSRETAFKIIYQIDIGKNDMETALQHTMNNDGLNDREQVFCRELVTAVEEKLADIDAIIQKHTTGWKVERMMSVDRNLLRLAVYEMLYSGHIAQKGAINEAVEMAKIYGKKESSGFINSVLDKVMKNEERKDSIVTDAAKEAMAEAPIKDEEKVTMIIEREVTEEEAEAILAGKMQ